jgi:hypothetical protein
MINEAYVTRYYQKEKLQTAVTQRLSVIISPGSFMYAIFSNHNRHVTELCHIEITQTMDSVDLSDKVAFLVNNYLLHQKKFEKVNIALLNSEFTLVPEVFGTESNPKEFLRYTTGLKEVKRSLQHSLKNLNFCFTAGHELVAYLERTFPNASLRHLGAVSISLFFSQHSFLNSDLYLGIGDGYIELAAKQKNELQFYNVFNYSNNEDILYYLLFAMEQLNLNPLNTRLVIAAQRGVNDELIKSIRKYVKQVNFCVSDPSIKLTSEMSALPSHHYFTLLNQHLCEL